MQAQQPTLYNKAIEMYGKKENERPAALPLAINGRKTYRLDYRYICVYNRLAAKGYAVEACREIAFKAAYATSKEALLDTFARYVKPERHPLTDFLLAHFQVQSFEALEVEPMLFPVVEDDPYTKQLKEALQWTICLNRALEEGRDPEDIYTEMVLDATLGKYDE